MSLIGFLQRRVRKGAPRAAPLVDRIRARIPAGGDAGLHDPTDPAEAERERRLGERFAAELHAYGAREPAGLARRAAAVSSAVRRRKTGELAEALDGVDPWELPALLEALEARRDLDRPALLALARRLAASATSWEMLAAALGIVGMAPAPADLDLLREAARSQALAGVCAMSAEALGPGALLEIAAASVGLGRALALERLGLACADRPGALQPLAPVALRLAASIEDAPARAYAAVPLLEVLDAGAALTADPTLADPVAACLEAAARGGWNGGPGPGLGRLPGAIRAAEALLAGDAPVEIRRRGAAAVLEAHPMPPGPVRDAAQALLDR